MDLVGKLDDFWETVVDRGAACEAECAFVFMAGRYIEHHAINGPRRRLHVGGTLSFRLPAAPAAEGMQSASAVAEAYQRSVEAFAGLVGRERVSYLGPMGILPRSLLISLASEPEAPFRVETVEQAALLAIDLIGAPPVTRLTTGMLRQACLNVENWAEGRPSTIAPVNSTFKDVPVTTATHESQYQGLTSAALTCFASAYRLKTGEFLVRIDGRQRGKRPSFSTAAYLREGVESGGIRGEAIGFAHNTAGWAALPPSARLGAVP